MTPDEHRFPTSPQTFRLEEANVDTVVTLARGDGISKSDWYRRAVVTQMVVELAGIESEQEVSTPVDVSRDTFSDPPSERKVEGVGHRGNKWG